MYNEDFAEWLDNCLKELPSETVAINFNLYESSDKTYDIQLIATNSFDEDDEDWACEEIFSTEESLFLIPITKDIENWEDGLLLISNIIKNYLNNGKHATMLKELEAIGLGFVDGDIELLYKK